VRLSILLPPTKPLDVLGRQAQEIERAHCDGVWMTDHLQGGTFFSHLPWHGCLTSLTTVVEATDTIRCGTLVASALLRPAHALGVELSTLAASGREIVAGIGGGAESDAQKLGVSRLTSDELQRYAEIIKDTGLPLLVAADTPRSLQVVTALDASWVTTGGVKLAGDEKVERFRSLLQLWRQHGSQKDITLLLTPNEASPWHSVHSMQLAAQKWSGEKVNELVLYPPSAYDDTAPGLSYEEAASICHAL